MSKYFKIQGFKMKNFFFSFLLLVFSSTIHCQEIPSNNFFIGISDFTEFFNYFNHQDVIANPVLVSLSIKMFQLLLNLKNLLFL